MSNDIDFSSMTDEELIIWWNNSIYEIKNGLKENCIQCKTCCNSSRMEKLIKDAIADQCGNNIKVLRCRCCNTMIKFL